MILAIEKGIKILATKTGQRANCPFCDHEVISKCGQIYANHWAHSTSESADKCEIHKTIQSNSFNAKLKLFWGAEFVERLIIKGDDRKIADIQLPKGLVIQVQNGIISTQKIEETEEFFNKMIWIFNLDVANDGRIYQKDKKQIWVFPRPSIKFCKKPVFIYISDSRILRVHDLQKFTGLKDANGRCTYIIDCDIITMAQFKEIAFSEYD